MSQKLKSLREGSALAPLSDLPADVLKAGLLKKLKKMKRKFFILRRGYRGAPSTLEYYPSEKKWRLGCEPKRSIVLKSCFNISRKLHPKHKYVVCLFSTEECFSIVLETEEEMNEWLSGLLELQLNEIDIDDEAKLRPAFEHVWQVVVDDRELEFSKSLNGPYCLGLTSKALTLVKISPSSENFDCLDFPLMSIRRCGHSGKHFFIELGRSAVTGAGGIWMETEGTIVAQNMHETILGAMKSSRNKEELGPHSRPRSASTSENSKPIATRRPVGVVFPQPTLNSSLASSRERCNTIPPRAQTISESLQDAAYSFVSSADSLSRQYYRENSRPHSVYAWPSSSSPTLSTFGFNNGSLSTSLYSNGSNVSFDEPESPQQSHLSWYTYGQSSDTNFMVDSPITEAPNEYLMMSPTDDNMNIITANGDYLNMNPASSQTTTTGEDNNRRSEPIRCPQNVQPSDYMDMRSPSSSEGYIPMSRVGSISADTTLNKRLSSASLSDNADRGDDGYVPMAPCGASEEVSVPMQDGYLSMSPLSSSLPKRSGSGVFSHSSFNGSNTTSEDDSTEFKLDKVQSLVKENEDIDRDFIKPVRAYSIGNRKQIYEARARAYSMGSERVRPDFEVTVDPHGGNLKDANCAAKSNSAPILQDSPSVSHKAAFEPVKECGGDLMEINYHKPEERTLQSSRESDTAAKKILSKSRQRTTSRSSCSTLPLVSLDEVNERGVCEHIAKTKRSVNHQNPRQHETNTDVKKIASTEDSSNYVEMNHGVESPFMSLKNLTISSSNSAMSAETTVQKSCCATRNVQKINGYSPSKPPNDFNPVLSRNSIPSDTRVLPMTPPHTHVELSFESKERMMSSKTLQNAASTFVKSAWSNNGSLKVESPSTWKGRSMHNSCSNPHMLEVKSSGCQGDYVNLTLNKPRRMSPPSLETSPKMENQSKSTREKAILPVCPTTEPDYANIKLGKPITPLPNPALVASQPLFPEPGKENGVLSPPVNTAQMTGTMDVHSRRSPNGDALASNMKPKSFGVTSLPPIKKQMSAPAVPSSLQHELVTPGRKSSCPVTASVSMVRSTAVSPASSSRLVCLPSTSVTGSFLKTAPSRSPDHMIDSSISSKGSSPKLTHSSTSGSQQSIPESQYENVSLPLSSSNSRPGSVSSEKELNYASLDLAPTTTGETPHSPSVLKISQQAALDDDDEPLTYAEIDFTKSEGLRHTGVYREGRL